MNTNESHNMMALVGRNAPRTVTDVLQSQGCTVVYMPENDWCYEPVNDHPDLFFTRIGETNTYIGDSRILKVHFKEALEYNAVQNTSSSTSEKSNKVLSSERHIGKAYPETVRLSAIFYGRYCIANESLLDAAMKQILKELNYVVKPVRQGYVKCTTVQIGNSCFLTSDRGIENVLSELGADVLFVDPKRIHMNGFPHGFIGGATFVFNNVIYFTGDIRTLDEFEAIQAFMRDKSLNWFCLSESPLVDIGSVSFFENGGE